MSQPIIDSLPELYRAFLPEIFFEATPSETIATCHDCIMCKDWEVKKANGEKYFKPEAKCCTFFPSLPNYLIGSLLYDQSVEMRDGVSRVTDIISSKIGVTPVFLRPPVTYNEKYKAFSKFNFGLASDLICPLNDRSTGNCTIWQHRNSVCSMWYCISVGGQAGKRFWHQSQQYFTEMEYLLSVYSARQLGVNIKLLLSTHPTLQADDLKGQIDMIKYSKVWHDWEGRELEFYKECYRIVSQLDHEAFKSKFTSRLSNKYQDMAKARDSFIEVANKKLKD